METHKSMLLVIAETPDILTEALKPGDQFVSIDGKKTYFDIGPSNAPTDGTYYYYYYRFLNFILLFRQLSTFPAVF